MKHHGFRRKRRNLLFVAIGALASLATVIGVALATPPSGVTPTVHALGATLSENVKVNADRIKFQTKDPVDVSVLTLKVEPGGTTGWHSHPGLAVIAVTKGTGTLYFADCRAKTYHAGQAFVEAGDDRPTAFRNETSSPVVLTVSFIAPKEAAVIRDEADQGCGVR